MNEDQMERFVELAVGWIRTNSLEKNATKAEITPDINLLETGLLDSLAFVELLAYLEAAEGIQIDLLLLDEDDFGTLRGLGRAAAEAI